MTNALHGARFKACCDITEHKPQTVVWQEVHQSPQGLWSLEMRWRGTTLLCQVWVVSSAVRRPASSP